MLAWTFEAICYWYQHFVCVYCFVLCVKAWWLWKLISGSTIQRGKAEVRAATQAWRVAKVQLEITKLMETAMFQELVRFA